MEVCNLLAREEIANCVIKGTNSKKKCEINSATTCYGVVCACGGSCQSSLPVVQSLAVRSCEVHAAAQQRRQNFPADNRRVYDWLDFVRGHATVPDASTGRQVNLETSTQQCAHAASTKTARTITFPAYCKRRSDTIISTPAVAAGSERTDLVATNVGRLENERALMLVLVDFLQPLEHMGLAVHVAFVELFERRALRLFHLRVHVPALAVQHL
jgi:hypothetical protein